MVPLSPLLWLDHTMAIFNDHTFNKTMTLIPNLPFNRIGRGFKGAFATGVTCLHWKLTHGILLLSFEHPSVHFVLLFCSSGEMVPSDLLVRTIIFPELVVILGLCDSNILRYFLVFFFFILLTFYVCTL